MGFFSKQKLSYILSFAACNERWMDEGGEEKRFIDETMFVVWFGNPFVDDTSNYKRQKIGRNRDHREISVMTL